MQILRYLSITIPLLSRYVSPLSINMSFSGRKFSISKAPGARYAAQLQKHYPPPPHNLLPYSTLAYRNSEVSSKIHRQFRNAHEGHQSHAGLDPSRASTGVVWCTERANEHGFADNPTAWANLGQGAPEVDDDIEGSFQRPTQIDISMNGREYGPTAGIKPLRAAIANLYNAHHRKGKDSQYSWENVAVVPVCAHA